jgi:hypothetical protein
LRRVLVVNPREAKRIVERVQKGIEASKDTPIWPHYINSLNLISQVVFVRASGFVLELIQNAEDADVLPDLYVEVVRLCASLGTVGLGQLPSMTPS